MTQFPRWFFRPTIASGSAAFLSTTALATGLTLSNGNLTVTATTSGADLSGRGDDTTAAITSGQKIYFEAILDTDSGVGSASVGICNSSYTFGSGQWLGLQTNGIGYSDDNNIYKNNASIGSIATYTAGDVVCVAVTGDTKVWFRKNGGNWNNSATANPATNTEGFTQAAGLGTVYPAYTCRNNPPADKITFRFSSSSWGFAAPSGFSAFA